MNYDSEVSRKVVRGKGQGFASMTKERQREAASKGGKAVHEKGTAYEWNSEQAREAGRKGGIASWVKRRAAKATNNV